MDKEIFYYSTVRGLVNDTNEKECLYTGKVFRLPRDVAGTDKQADFEEGIFQYLGNLKKEDEFEPVEPVERYEVFDKESGDILVMVRVPYLRISGGDDE